MLSRKTKYALKALTFLARQTDKTPVQTAQISESENISHKYLEAILLSLRNLGYLGSKKGKGGGYYLLKPSNQIQMVDLLRKLEGPIAMVPCVSLNYYEKCEDCVDEESCSVHLLMIEVRDSTLRVLENKSLADII
ncbi:MAG: RrF2 family transcriptional regulator [Salibacteraceae bacterium]